MSARDPGPGRALRVAAFALLSAMAMPARAAQATDALTLEFDVPYDLRPDHLCVVSTGAASVLLAKLSALRAEPAAHPGSGRDATAAATWAFRPGAADQARRADQPLHDLPDIVDSVAALELPSDGGGCRTEGTGACAATFDITASIRGATPKDLEKLHFACAPNVRATGHDVKQVAVVFVTSHAEFLPPLVSITLDGNVATLVLRERIAQRRLLASVIGGHYAPGATSTSIDRRIILPLVPRCPLHDLDLPFFDGRSDDTVRVLVNEAGAPDPVVSCTTSPVDGAIAVRLPARPTERQRTVEITGTRSGVRFVGSWSERVPPRPLRTALRSVSLGWKRHCLFPSATCPEARLLDSGIDCRPRANWRGPSEHCAYVCDVGERNFSIRLPEDVRFLRADTNQTWNARLSYGGQVVDDYLPPGDLGVRVRVPPASLDSALQSAVSGIKVYFPSGEIRTLAYLEGQSLTLPTPNARCEDAPEFMYAAPALHTFERHALAGGVVELRSPESTRLPFGFGITVGLGHETNPVWARHDRAQRFGQGAYGTIGASIHWMRAASSWTLEVPIETTIGRREYLVRDRATGVTTERGAAISRILAGVGGGARVWRLGWTAALTGGGSVAGSWNDYDVFPWSWVLSPMFRMRYFIGGGSSIVLTGRAFFFERRRIVDAGSALVTTERRNLGAVELAWEYSLAHRALRKLAEESARDR